MNDNSKPVAVTGDDVCPTCKGRKYVYTGDFPHVPNPCYTCGQWIETNKEFLTRFNEIRMRRGLDDNGMMALLDSVDKNPSPPTGDDNSKPKPGDGGAFDRVMTMIDEADTAFNALRLATKLRAAHNSDRAADRAEIERLNQEIADQKEVYGCAVGELKEEIERLKADKAELVDALRYKCGRMSVTERIEGEWGWDNRAEKILTKHTEAKRWS